MKWVFSIWKSKKRNNKSKCGEYIIIDNTIYNNNLLKSNDNLSESLIWLKNQLKIIINSNNISINKIVSQLKILNI